MLSVYDPPLVSNGYPLSSAPHRLGHLVPSDPQAPLAELREQYQAQGYLWLKGILDRDTILAFRGRYFVAMSATGILAPDTDPVEGLYSGRAPDRSLHDKLVMEFVRTAAYEAFCLDARIWQFYEAFLDGPVYLHKRKIVRASLPGAPSTTPAHYDLIYLRGGTSSVCTSWIPIGDIPVEMGGLVYLEGSDRIGREMEAEFNAHNSDLSPEERVSAYNKHMSEGGWVGKDLAAMADRFDTRWLIADYEAGDMVVHSAHMIHASTLNTHPTNIRLSTDIRYQRVRDEIDARWEQHWSLNDML
jgi:ectoine hydroxylase-related dioxygenase (phytanoyl-CoA dioxygenase family)